jgi:hypothetical protein
LFALADIGNTILQSLLRKVTIGFLVSKMKVARACKKVSSGVSLAPLPGEEVLAAAYFCFVSLRVTIISQ